MKILTSISTVMFNASCNALKVSIEWSKGFNNSIDLKSVHSVILRLKCIYYHYFFIIIVIYDEANSNVHWILIDKYSRFVEYLWYNYYHDYAITNLADQ